MTKILIISVIICCCLFTQAEAGRAERQTRREARHQNHQAQSVAVTVQRTRVRHCPPGGCH